MPFLAILVACAEPEPDTTVTGAYTLDLAFSPDPPQVGRLEIGLDVTDALGEPVPGCVVDVRSWMPEHGHGGATDPSLVASEGGHYDLDWTCGMAGHWELTVVLACPAGDDGAVVDVDVR